MPDQAAALWKRAKSLAGQPRMPSLTTGLILAFSTLFMGGMLWYYWPTLASYQFDIVWWPLIASGIAYMFHLLLSVAGWSMIMRQLGVGLGFREHFKIYCITRVAGRIPGAPWHLVGRAVLYKRAGISGAIIGVASGLEMVLVVMSGILSGFWVWFVLPQSAQWQMIWLTPIFLLCIVMASPTFLHRILKKLGREDVGAHLRYRDNLSVLVVFVLGWVASGLVLYLLIISLYPLPLLQLPGVVGAWSISGAISLLVFFSPTAFGLKEITLALILSFLVPGGIAVVVTVLARVLLTAAELVAAALASRL